MLEDKNNTKNQKKILPDKLVGNITKPSRVYEITLSIIVVLIVGTCFPLTIYSQTSQPSTIDASVKISVCGNDIKEGGEDCDNQDLGGKTCKTLGYGGGVLSCHPSCSYLTDQCAPLPPSEEQKKESQNEKSDTTNEQSAEQAQMQENNQNELSTQKEIRVSNLPKKLAIFDIDGDGILTKDELPQLIEKWVNKWNVISKDNLLKKEEFQTCDLDKDGDCDVYDFSILLYYIERQPN